jgi:hypothetical protein
MQRFSSRSRESRLQAFNPLDQALTTQELFCVHLLHRLITIVQENVSLNGSLPVPRHHRRREYHAYPTWRLREVPTRHVYHDQVPLPLVNLFQQVV